MIFDIKKKISFQTKINIISAAMCVQIQSVIIDITLFILVQSAHDTPWCVDQLGDNKHNAIC